MFSTRRIFGDNFPDRPKKTVVRLKSFGRSVQSFCHTPSEHTAADHGLRAGLQSLLGDGAIAQRRLPPRACPIHSSSHPTSSIGSGRVWRLCVHGSIVFSNVGG